MRGSEGGAPWGYSHLIFSSFQNLVISFFPFFLLVCFVILRFQARFLSFLFMSVLYIIVQYNFNRTQ